MLRYPLLLVSLLFCVSALSHSASSQSFSDNGVAGLPEVDCMEDRLRLTFHTQRPFTGRLFVKGMVDKERCVSNFATKKSSVVSFDLMNGECNMRRARRLGPDQRGVEQSITVIISFHPTFITKVDRAFRCTCFYMEADKVVTSRFDVSQLPTTDLIDTARMPLCTYSVRRQSVTGPIVEYAVVGENVFHVWQCESDMFSMLVHSCFVDDGTGQDKKPIIDENGCSSDPAIIPDLTYNPQNNLAYSEVSVFKFADKVTTYFQCALSTCMISEGMCAGKTPPRCSSPHLRLVRSAAVEVKNRTRGRDMLFLDNTMDLAANKIVVLDMEEAEAAEAEMAAPPNHLHLPHSNIYPQTSFCLGVTASSFLLVLAASSLLLASFIGLLFLTRMRSSYGVARKQVF